MFSTRDATEVLDHDFLEARCKILEIAATLDRIDRAPARTASIPTHGSASSGKPSRPSSSPAPAAQTIQRIFSLEYDPPGARR